MGCETFFFFFTFCLVFFYRCRLSTLSMLLSPESWFMLLTALSAGERREERVARSIWRFVCWCIRLEEVSYCYWEKGV